MTEQQQAMQQLRRHKFAIIDAGMYLDGHPEDETALQYFRSMCEQYTKAAAVYQKNFGALQPCDAAGKRWTWIDAPWPWEGA